MTQYVFAQALQLKWC